MPREVKSFPVKRCCRTYTRLGWHCYSALSIVPRYVHIIFSCFQWSNHSLSSFFLNRCLHLSTCKFYWFIPLYTLNSWSRMSIVYTQFYLRLLDLYLVAYMDFYFRKIRWHLFTNSVFCIIFFVMWIPFANSVVWIGIFTQHHIRII